MLIFDIGANVGKYSIANCMNNHIIAIEASKVVFSKLSFEVSDYENILPLNYAVCNNNNQDITFYQCDTDTLSTTNIDWLTSKTSRFYGKTFSTIKVPTITIDSLIEKYGVPNIIKIDVEGGEYDCISSLTKKVSKLSFEWASETNDITFKCLDYLHKIGFNKFFIQDKDEYTFTPKEDTYTSLDITKQSLSKTKPKKDWGMIHCI